MSQFLNVIKLQEGHSQENQSLTFDEVFREYERPLYNYLLHMTQNQATAEDLAQETFIRVHRSLPTFRGEANLATWLYRIATNVSFDYFRWNSVRRAKSDLSLEEAEFGKEWADETSPSPEEQATQSEMSTCVQRFIQRLPPTYRAVLVLHDLQGLKNHEIAVVLDCPLSTVKIRLHRARNKLRAVLNAGCDFAHNERNVFVCEPKTENEGGTRSADGFPHS